MNLMKRWTDSITVILFLGVLFTIASPIQSQAQAKEPVVINESETKISEESVIKPIDFTGFIPFEEQSDITHPSFIEIRVQDIMQTKRAATEADRKEQEVIITDTDIPEQPAPIAPVSYGFVQKNGQVADHWVTDVEKRLQYVPDYLKEAFTTDGWTFYVTDMNIDQTYFDGYYGSIQGLADFDNHIIWIEARTKAVKEAPIHEMGHWLDWHYGFVSDSEEFGQIYLEETDALIRSFNVDYYYDIREMFADGVWRYLTEPEKLQANCPRLYEFVSRYV